MSIALDKAAWELGRLRAALPADEEPTVQQLRANAAGAHWIFTTRRQAAFWAGLPIPPELAVLPWKRRVSGQVSPVQVRDVLERFRPELVLLVGAERHDFGLTSLLETHYRPSAENGDLHLLRKDAEAATEE